MKKFMTIFVIMTVLCTIFTIYGSAIAGGEDYGSVPYTYNILALDAIKEDTYTHALHINGNLERDGGSINAGADYWLIYDDTYLWMFVEIKDSTLNTAADDELTSSYKVDSIEIMLDFTNKGENIVDETPYQCRVDHQGFVSGRIGQGGTSLFGTPAQGGDVDFFESAATGTDAGFNIELRWKLSDFNLAMNSDIGINCCYNDWDETGETRIEMVSTIGVTSWLPDSYGFVKLGDVSEGEQAEIDAAAAAAEVIAADIIATETETTTAAAAQTGDFLLLGLTVFVLSNVILLKKRK